MYKNSKLTRIETVSIIIYFIASLYFILYICVQCMNDVNRFNNNWDKEKKFFITVLLSFVIFLKKVWNWTIKSFTLLYWSLYCLVCFNYIDFVAKCTIYIQLSNKYISWNSVSISALNKFIRTVLFLNIILMLTHSFSCQHHDKL